MRRKVALQLFAEEMKSDIKNYTSVDKRYQ